MSRKSGGYYTPLSGVKWRMLGGSSALVKNRLLRFHDYERRIILKIF